MQMDHNCKGTHRFFVSEVKGSSADKEVWVILVCTSCGEGRRLLIPLDPKLPILSQK